MPIAEGLALAAAACIALSGMLVSELKGRIDVMRLARWQMLAAFVMTAVAALASGGFATIGRHQLLLLAASSLFGIIIASTTYYSAIYVAGPRVTAMLFTLASPFSLLLGYVALDERVSAEQMAGIALVFVGILMAIGLRRRASVTAVEPAMAGPDVDPPLKLPPPAQAVSAFGITLGVITAIGQALGSLFARPAMEAGVDPFAAMAVRSGIAALFFLLLTVLPLRVFRTPYAFRWNDLGLAVGAAFFGTGLGMSLLMAALATGNVGIVTTLSSMTPILILPMVWFRSGVPPVRAAWVGAAIAVAGTALISLERAA